MARCNNPRAVYQSFVLEGEEVKTTESRNKHEFWPDFKVVTIASGVNEIDASASFEEVLAANEKMISKLFGVPLDIMRRGATATDHSHEPGHQEQH